LESVKSTASRHRRRFDCCETCWSGQRPLHGDRRDQTPFTSIVNTSRAVVQQTSPDNESGPTDSCQVPTPRRSVTLSPRQQSSMSINREELYEAVWAGPMTVVATRFEVSANYLARVCHHLNVPHPPRGYWAKLSFGKKPKRPPLPDARPGEVPQWTRGDSVPRVARPLHDQGDFGNRGKKIASHERPARHPLSARCGSSSKPVAYRRSGTSVRENGTLWICSCRTGRW
jgi:hypothetical protein